MIDFRAICIRENLLVFAYFLMSRRIYLVSLGNPTFSNIFPRARHILMTFKLWPLCARLCIFSLYISHLLQSSQQASIAMWTILISKSWWWLLQPRRWTSTLIHYKFTYLDYVFLLSSSSSSDIYIYIYVCIYIYIYIYIYYFFIYIYLFNNMDVIK